MKYNKLIFLKPYLSQKIWGGNRLKEFGYDWESDKVGEALLVSTINHMESKVIDNKNNQELYSEFFNNNKAFFNDYKKPYPILTKIIDANDDLSIQVHPDDQYALAKHHCLGKTECWYILDAKPDAKLIYGLKINDIKEIRKRVNNKQWEGLFNEVKVKQGDFIYVPSGTVHAIGKGILLYELQQSSDITYRLYDYDRLENNKPRQLHIEDSLNVIKTNQILKIENKQNDVLVNNDFFYLEHCIINANKTFNFPKANWTEFTVINGLGKIDNEIEIKKGDIFVLAHNESITINGTNLEILISFSNH